MTTIEVQTTKHINSSGIKLKYAESHGWVATVEFSTWEHGIDSCIEGSIGLRYFHQDLTLTVDRALAAAKTIGVVFHDHTELAPCIYVEGDGEDPSVQLPPNWRHLVQVQCERLGWQFVYQDDLTATQEPPAEVQ